MNRVGRPGAKWFEPGTVKKQNAEVPIDQQFDLAIAGFRVGFEPRVQSDVVAKSGIVCRSRLAPSGFTPTESRIRDKEGNRDHIGSGLRRCHPPTVRVAWSQSVTRILFGIGSPWPDPLNVIARLSFSLPICFSVSPNRELSDHRPAAFTRFGIPTDTLVSGKPSAVQPAHPKERS
jgi:hypothetical protein